MLASPLSSTTKVVTAAVAGLLLLSTASHANSYDQLFPGGAYGMSNSDARAHYSSRSSSGFTTPNDFVSSHVCVNGYRWITRDFERGWGSPAEDAIPVRC